MQVELMAFLVSDPLLFSQAVEASTRELSPLSGSSCPRVGLGYFDGRDPLRYDLRSADRLGPALHELVTREAMACCFVRRDGGLETLPLRYRDWMCGVGGEAGLVLEDGLSELPIPTYIQGNMMGQAAGEVLFHLYLAFLHRNGLFGSEPAQMSHLLEALRSALSLLPHTKVLRDRSGLSLVVSDGRQTLGAALGRPVHFLHRTGLPLGPSSDEHLENGEAPGLDGHAAHLRSLVLMDTDRLPTSDWSTIPCDHLFEISRDLDVRVHPL